MDTAASWMIYGANGYTGRLIAREAVQRGMRPVLAGRSAGAIAPLAHELGCPSRVFTLDQVESVASHLHGMKLVLHCAGPFSQTAAPMMDACLLSTCHYLDITGEIDTIEAGAARHQAARDAKVAMMPAVGFDVVPSDCLAAILARELPDATRLQLAFSSTGGLSPGTTKTMVENLPRGGRARIDGSIRQVPAAWKSMEVPFRGGRKSTMTIPWGDVASAYYSTGISNIEVYSAMPEAAIRRARKVTRLAPLLGLAPVQKLLKWYVGRSVAGPNEAQREKSRASFWGRVTNAEGRSVEATLETPGGYPLTVETSLAVVQRILAGEGPMGFATPSRAFGADFILSFAGVDLQWAQPTRGVPQRA